MKRVFLAILAWLGMGWPVWGEPASLLDTALFQSGRQPLLAQQVRGGILPGNGTVESRTERGGSASLFAGRQSGSLFAPYQRRVSLRRANVPVAGGGEVKPGGFGPIARLRALIGRAEAGAGGYDAVQNGAVIKPEKLPTEMSLGEIYAWIEATPGQPHAIGYYQFIPATLKRLVAQLGVGADEVFSPALQDRLGDLLLAEAGLHAMGRGEIDRHTFMANMAKIWAGLPNPDGLSHYEGIAGNTASLTWAYFDQEMARIFPG